MNFCKTKKCQLMLLFKNFSKTLHVPAVSLPGHNSSAQPPDELPGDLIWVRWGGVIPPLQPLYNGPYAVLRRGPRSFTILVGSRTRSSPSAASRLARPRSHAWQPALARQTARFAPRRSCRNQEGLISDPLVSSPSPPALPRDGPGTIFLPGEEVFARPGPVAPSQVPPTRYPSRQWAPPQRLDLWFLLLPAEARARGEPCGHLHIPLATVRPVGCTPPTLYCICI